MTQRPLDVDQVAARIFNRAATIVGGMGDQGEALQLCRDLVAIEPHYVLVLKTELFSAAQRGSERRALSGAPRSTVPAGSAAFVGRALATKFSSACMVCGKSLPAGTDAIWQRGVGCACLGCGEVVG